MHGISVCIHNYMQIIKGGKYSFFSSFSIGSKDTFSYPIWACRSLFPCYFGTKCTKFVVLKGRAETITGALMPWGDEENSVGRLPQLEVADGYHTQLYWAVQGKLCRFCQWLVPACVELYRAFSSYFEVLLECSWFILEM